MRRLNDEDGSMAVTVGVLFSALIAVMAMAVDGGVLHNERQELQNGADAAALAVAFSCARGSCDPALADEYATANARLGGTTAIESIDIDMAAQTVEVVTQTPDTPLEAMKMADDGQETALVRARGKARWGTVGSTATPPFVISQCDVDAGVAAQGGSLYTTAPATQGVILVFHDSTGGTGDVPTCPSHSGMDADGDGFLPGGFGKIEIDADCKVVTYTDDADDVWASAKEGASMGGAYSGCLKMGLMAIPVFGDFRTSPDKEYRIIDYVGFHVTGWRFPAAGGGGLTNADCKNAMADQLGVPLSEVTGTVGGCVSGHFVEATVADGAFCSNPDPAICALGVKTARMTY